MPLVPASLFDRTACDRVFVPTKLRSAGACSGGPGRPSGRRPGALPWTAANPAARWRTVGIGAAVLVIFAWGDAPAEVLRPPPSVTPWIAEAAARFALPPAWIAGVMRRESGFQAQAVSPAGALGLMQVMPGTYAGLRRRYALGGDAFAPRDNILAGAAYLRELYDRFGPGGFLAAYNAGPLRYSQALVGATPLPRETERYAAALRLDLGLPMPPAPAVTPLSSLFVEISPASPPLGVRRPSPPATGGLFAPIDDQPQEPSHGR